MWPLFWPDPKWSGPMFYFYILKNKNCFLFAKIQIYFGKKRIGNNFVSKFWKFCCLTLPNTRLFVCLFVCLFLIFKVCCHSDGSESGPFYPDPAKKRSGLVWIHIYLNPANKFFDLPANAGLGGAIPTDSLHTVRHWTKGTEQCIITEVGP